GAVVLRPELAANLVGHRQPSAVGRDPWEALAKVLPLLDRNREVALRVGPPLRDLLPGSTLLELAPRTDLQDVGDVNLAWLLRQPLEQCDGLGMERPCGFEPAAPPLGAGRSAPRGREPQRVGR